VASSAASASTASSWTEMSADMRCLLASSAALGGTGSGR
jgi:hypothetical protein